MKKIILLSAVLPMLFASCKKEKAGASVPAVKYACTCIITLSYVDHCGTETTSDTSYIYSHQRTGAEESCKSKSSRDTSTYTITEKECTLQ